VLQEEVDLLLLRERDRRKRLLLDKAASEGGAGPVDVFVQCPQGAVVSIADLPDEEVEQGVCNVLRVEAPNLRSHMALRCDGVADVPFFSVEDDDGAGEEDGWVD
jgi:hypothetical protein